MSTIQFNMLKQQFSLDDRKNRANKPMLKESIVLRRLKEPGRRHNRNTFRRRDAFDTVCDSINWTIYAFVGWEQLLLRRAIITGGPRGDGSTLPSRLWEALLRGQRPNNRRVPIQLKRIDCVGTILRRRRLEDWEILLVWNADWRTPSWSLPGGAREAGESLRQAAARETQEETGLAVTVSDLVDVHEKIGVGGRIHLVIFTFEGHVTGGSLIPDGAGEPDTGGVSAARWFSTAEAREMPSVARVLDARPTVGGWTRCAAELLWNPAVGVPQTESIRRGR